MALVNSPKFALASVVIMAPENGGGLLRSLASVREQVRTLPIEIIVVEAVPGAADSLAASDVVVVSTDRPLTPGETRNVGVRVAKGDVIMFLAGDCVAESGWTSERLRLHESGWEAVAGAVVHAGPRTPRALGAHYFIFGHRDPSVPSGEVRFPDPRGHGLSYSRSVMEEMGEFSPDLRIGEDSEMYRRLGDAGYSVYFSSSICVGHLGNWSPVGVIKDLYQRGCRRGDIESLTGGLLWKSEETGLARRMVHRTIETSRTMWRSNQYSPLLRAASILWMGICSVCYHYGWALRRARTRHIPADREANGYHHRAAC